MTVRSLVPTGVALLVLVAVQLLTGPRLLGARRRLQLRVHRWSGYVTGILVLVHGLMGLVLAFHWSVF